MMQPQYGKSAACTAVPTKETLDKMSSQIHAVTTKNMVNIGNKMK